MNGRYKVLLGSMALYLIACSVPALLFHVRVDCCTGRPYWGGYRSVRGIDLLGVGLLWGWIRFNFTAFANLPLWLSWILLARGRYFGARASSALAMIISVETLQLIYQPMLWDEGASHKGYLAAPHVGCVLWLGSMFLVWWYSQRALRDIRVIASD